jgi:short-subunit dehydrogenase
MKLMPRSNSPDIAEVGWRGFKAGKRIVIPRLIDRISVAISVLLPQSLLTRFVGLLQRPR